MLFRNIHNPIGSLMRPRPRRKTQQTAQSVYSTPCGRGISYIGETGRRLAVWLCEHRHSMLEKLKLVPLALGDAQRLRLDEAWIFGNGR